MRKRERISVWGRERGFDRLVVIKLVYMKLDSDLLYLTGACQVLCTEGAKGRNTQRTSEGTQERGKERAKEEEWKKKE